MRQLCRGSAVIERLGAFLNTRMQTAQPDFEEAGITHVVSYVSGISKGQLGIENMLQSDSIRGTWKLRGYDSSKI